MLDQGYHPEQAAQANQHTLRFREQIASRPEPAPVFTNLVLEQLSARFPIGWIEHGGLRIRTSLDYDLPDPGQLHGPGRACIEMKIHLPREPICRRWEFLAEAARLLPTIPSPPV
jgi:hypothetical protein